jgi:glycosyltransferase involved in cell wall biosynthesis
VINGRFLVQQATGVQRVAREVTAEIDSLLARGELDAQVTLLVPPGDWVQSLELRYIDIVTVGRVQGFLWEQCELPRHVRGDVLLSLGNSAPLIKLMRRDSRVAVMIHDVSFLDHPRAYKFRYRLAHRAMLPWLLRGASHIFTVSETERERLLQIADIHDKITVAPNGGWTGPPSSPLEAGLGADKRYALYVGSLSYRKNFGRILSVAIQMARDDDLDFVFVGATGSILRRPGHDVPEDIAHRIHFLGQINDRARLGRIYANARVLVFPSLYEACPLPPVEAAYFGCPVVVSNIPSMWERCGRHVTYCDPRSVDSIVRATRSALSDPPRARRAAPVAQPMSGTCNWSAQARTVCEELLPGSLITTPAASIRARAS